MKCRICGNELADRWNYCPFCGAHKNFELEKSFEEVLNLFEKSFRDLLGVDFSGAPGKGFIVEVSQERGVPKVNIRELVEEREIEDEANANTGANALRNIDAVEPKVEVRGGGKTVEVYLPGVDSENEVHLKKFENSVEVRAAAGEKTYFAIIPNVRSRFMKHKFEKGLLTLSFSP